MNFFEAQERARQRSRRLVVLFALAVAGTIGATYAAVLLPLGPRGDYWDPELFVTVAVAVLTVVGAAALFKWSQMRRGGAAVAEMVGGRRIDGRTKNPAERRLLNIVEEMAIASGVPVPAVYVLDEERGINAFAAGLTSSDAAVAVTRGTLEKLSRDELQGVVAHEFSHILNGDMRINVRFAAIVFGILAIGLIGRGLLRSLGRARIRVGGGRNRGGEIALVVAIGVALLVIGYIGYFFGRMIQAAVSRQREFLADASAVQFTRNPAGIAGALRKIGGYALGSRIAEPRAAEIGHFFFAQGFSAFFGKLWATHPPLDERIRAVDAGWDGGMFEPPERVDIESESLASAGHGTQVAAAFAAAGAARIPPAAEARIAFPAASVVARIGEVDDADVAATQRLLDSLPAALHEASRDPDRAAALVYAVLAASSGCDRSRALELVRQHDAPPAADAAGPLFDAAAGIAPAAKLPLIQVALGALRGISGPQIERFAGTLDELVHADGKVSMFELALQKIVLRHVRRAADPAASAPRFQSFQPLADDFSMLLSAVAHAAGAETAAAFANGRAQLPLLSGRLSLRPQAECGVWALDEPLDRIATATLPIRRQALVAAAHAIGTDGVVTTAEAELYRALAAALDCPSPTLSKTC